MNTQRMVIYAQRRRVLEGQDLSGDMREWHSAVTDDTGDLFLEGDFSEEWDLDGLVQAMTTLYGSDVTLDGLRDGAELEAAQQAQNGNLQYAHETAAGADAIAGAAAVGSSVAGAGAIGSGGSTSTASPRTVVASEHEKLGRNDPCWCGSGKKFKKCH